MSEYIRNQILGIADNFKALASMAGDIEQVARICTDTLKAGNKIMFCGNGGSAADSQHLAAELVGRYKLNRPAMNALALTVDTSILTAVGNDYGYETVFSRQLEGVGRPGDLLVGLSTSGNSRNIVLAMELARRMGVDMPITNAVAGVLFDGDLPHVMVQQLLSRDPRAEAA